jgi:hypothetical protein
MSPSQLGPSAQEALKAENYGAVAFLDVPPGSRGPSGCRAQAGETGSRAKPAQPEKSHPSVDEIMNVELIKCGRVAADPWMRWMTSTNFSYNGEGRWGKIDCQSGCSVIAKASFFHQV